MASAFIDGCLIGLAIVIPFGVALLLLVALIDRGNVMNTGGTINAGGGLTKAEWERQMARREMQEPLVCPSCGSNQYTITQNGWGEMVLHCLKCKSTQEIDIT